MTRRTVERPKQERLQADTFIETTRAIGAGEDEAAFRAKLAVIARQKPKENVPEPPKGKVRGDAR